MIRLVSRPRAVLLALLCALAVMPALAQAQVTDLNAAINLKNLAVSSTVSACGEEGSGLGCKLKAKPASVKQELSTKHV